jgi:hypothetical protein
MPDLGPLDHPVGSHGHRGTRAGDDHEQRFPRSAQPWITAAVAVAGIISTIVAVAVAKGRESEKIVRLESDVVAIKSDLAKIEPLGNLVGRLDERTKLMKDSVDRIEAVVAPRNPNERINLMTHDTRTQP